MKTTDASSTPRRDIEGKLKGKDARILGRFKGEIDAQRAARARRGRAGRRQGDGRRRPRSRGEFKGELKATAGRPPEKARVKGTIDAQSLVVREGAQLTGPSPPASRPAKLRLRSRPRRPRRAGPRSRPAREPARAGRPPRLRAPRRRRASRSARVAGHRATPARATSRFVANPRYAGQARHHARLGRDPRPRARDARCRACVSREPLPGLRARGGAAAPERRGPRPASTPPRRWTRRAVLGEGVHVGPLAVVGRGRPVGARTVVHPHVVLYRGRRGGRGLRAALGRAGARGLPARPPRGRAERRRDRRRRLRLRDATRTAATRRSRRSASW